MKRVTEPLVYAKIVVLTLSRGPRLSCKLHDTIDAYPSLGFLSCIAYVMLWCHGGVRMEAYSPIIPLKLIESRPPPSVGNSPTDSTRSCDEQSRNNTSYSGSFVAYYYQGHNRQAPRQ
jgi:hypothetical protein